MPPSEWYDHVILSCVHNFAGYHGPVTIFSNFELNWMGIVFSSGRGGFAIESGNLESYFTRFVGDFDFSCSLLD